MDIQIANDIKELLMEDGTAVVPSFGAFVSTYKPAVVDSISGTIQPPSYHISFDANRQINDGKLVDCLREQHRISATAAQEMIDDFVREAKVHFAKNEIVILPEVGRLYRDSITGNTQFLPENVNFNADTFGLPTVSTSPVSRHRPEPILSERITDVEPALPPTLTMTKTEAINKPLIDPLELPQPMGNVPPPIIIDTDKHPAWISTNWQSWIPALAVAVLVILVAVIWLNAPDTKGGQGAKKRINASPQNTTAENATGGGAPNQPIQVPLPPHDTAFVGSDQFFSEPKKKSEAQTNVQPQTLSAHRATIIIGGFAQKANIIRLKKWITAQGYSVYEKKRNGLTMIGCEFGYETEKEFRRVFNKVKVRYGDELEVIKN